MPNRNESTSGIQTRSTKKMLFYSLNILIMGFLFGLWNQVQFFAVSLLLIPQATIVIVYLVFSIVDSANDPILGYLTDKSKRFTAKYGKRYPWIIIGALLSPIPIILCYIPIAEIRVDATGNVINPEAVIIAAIWLAFMMSAYETLSTVREVNYSSLTPDLFRGEGQRRKVGAFQQIMDFLLRIINAILIPLLLAIFGGATSITAYIGTVIIIVSITYILIIPMKQGIREPDDMKLIRSKLDGAGKSTSPVKEVVLRVLKDKNWMSFTLAYFCYAIGGMCVIAGLNFFVMHSLGLGIEATILPLFCASAFGLIGIPIFSTISKKAGAKMGYLISFVWIAVFYISFLFVTDIIGVILTVSFGGIGLLGQNYMFIIVSSEAIDNGVVKSSKREEGTFYGILRVFSGFANFFQALIFAIMTAVTGYNAVFGANQSPIAKLGLKLQMSLIPLILLLIGTLIFVLNYDINKKKALENKEKLVEMKI